MPKERRQTKKDDSLKFDRAELLDSLTKLKSGIGKGTAIPSYSHIWFNEQHAFSYNGGLGIRVPLDTELNCGVPGLAALVRTAAAGRIHP